MRRRDRSEKRKRSKRQTQAELDCDHQWSKFGCLICGAEPPTKNKRAKKPKQSKRDIQVVRGLPKKQQTVTIKSKGVPTQCPKCKSTGGTERKTCKRCGGYGYWHEAKIPKSKKRKPLSNGPSVQEHTEVFELDSLEAIEALFKRLRKLKRVAPRSLRYTVAVTARRIVTFRGNNGYRPDITKRLEN